MAAAFDTLISEEEYLEQEERAETKSEYWRGRVYAMAGVSELHALIVWNVAGEFRQQMRGRSCRAYSSDLKVRIESTGLYTYPDVAALCGRAEFAKARGDVLLNPQVLVEVLSPSTEATDRGWKWAHYQLLPSLTDYLMVAQDGLRVEHYRRTEAGDAWLYREYRDLNDVVELSSVGCRLSLAEIYDKVDLPAVADGPDAPVEAAHPLTSRH
jgi:Uma2 family endonuclease